MTINDYQIYIKDCKLVLSVLMELWSFKYVSIYYLIILYSKLHIYFKVILLYVLCYTVQEVNTYKHTPHHSNRNRTIWIAYRAITIRIMQSTLLAIRISGRIAAVQELLESCDSIRNWRISRFQQRLCVGSCPRVFRDPTQRRRWSKLLSFFLSWPEKLRPWHNVLFIHWATEIRYISNTGISITHEGYKA